MSEKQNKDGIEENSFGLLRFLYDAKQIMFEVVTVLLKANTFGFYFRIFLIFIEFVQISHYLFKDPIANLWKQDNFIESLHDISGYTLILPHIVKSEDWKVYQTVFYLCVSIIVFMTILLLILIFSLKKKQKMMQWPITATKIGIDLFSTILYLPFFDLFINVLNCSKNEEGNSMNNLFPEIACFTGSYISYTILAGIVVVIMVSVIGLITLINYECRFDSNNCFTKTSAYGDLAFLAFKTLIAIIFASFRENDFQVIIILIFFICTFFLFSYFSFNVYYLNQTISKIITTLHACNLWGVLMLILATITQDYQFKASAYIYLIGIPFIIFIVMSRVEQKFEYLLLNSNNYESLPMALNQLQYLTKLIGMYKQDKQIKILLDGFLDYHRTFCNKEECVSKKRVMKTNKFSKEMRSENESETFISIISVIQTMYYYGLQKYPSSTRLRILYALFLLDKMRSKQQALQELLNAEQESPSFDEQFIIFRYKIIIEAQLTQNSGQGGEKQGNNEMVNELSIQYHLNMCKSNIEGSANLHVEFWGQLSEDQPDLGKLSDLGFKISLVNSMANEQWQKLLLINNNMISMTRLFAQYQIFILNDKQGGQQLLEKLQDQANEKNMSKTVDMQSESRPAVVMSAEEDTFAFITNINSAAVSLIGFSKIELLNRNIKVIMPSMYGIYHDYFLQNYLTTLEPILLGKTRFLPVRTKVEYALQTQFIVRAIPSLIHGLQFLGIGMLSKSLSQNCFFIIDLKGRIVNISSQCTQILGINLKKIVKKNVNLKDLILDIDINDDRQLNQLFSKTGAKYRCHSASRKKSHFYALIKFEVISFRQVGLQGYQVNLEKIKDLQGPNDMNLEVEKSDEQLDIQVDSKYHLEMKYDWQQDQFRGQIIWGPSSVQVEDQNNNTVMNLFYNEEGSKGGEDILNITNHLQEEYNNDDNAVANGQNPLDQIASYGMGIRVVRLVNEKQLDIEDLKREEEQIIEELEEDENQYKFENGIQQDNEEGAFDIQKIFKNRDSFLKFIQESNFLNVRTLQNLKIYAVLSILILSVLSLVNQFVVDKELSESQDRYNIISKSNVIIASAQTILSKCLELYAVNKNLITFSNNTEKKFFITSAYEGIEYSLQKMEEIQNYLDLSELQISEKHKNLYSDDIVPMRFFANDGYKIIKYGLNDATQQVITKVNAIKDEPINMFDSDNTDFLFLQYNLLNEYYEKQRTNANYYVVELDGWVSDKQNMFIMLFLLGGLSILFLYLCLFPFFLLVNKAQKEILVVFLDIPVPKVKQLLYKCETFVTQMQSGNEEEIQTEQSLRQFLDEDDAVIRARNSKRKKFKIDLKNQQNFFVPLTLACLVLVTYYCLAYVFGKEISDRFSVFISENNSTNQAESYFGLCNNAIKQISIDYTFPILGSSDSISWVNESIDTNYDLLANIQNLHSNNINLHDNTYINAYNQVMMNSTNCDTLSARQNVSQADCENFMDGSILEGLSLSFPRHLENYRLILTEFYELQQQKNNGAITNTEFENSVKQLINLNEMKEIEEFQYDYMRNLFRYLIEEFEASLQQMKNTTNTTRITILIISILLILIIYLLIWIPILSSITREVIRIRTMITMIPLDICISTRSIRHLIQKYQKTKQNVNNE